MIYIGLGSCYLSWIRDMMKEALAEKETRTVTAVMLFKRLMILLSFVGVNGKLKQVVVPWFADSEGWMRTREHGDDEWWLRWSTFTVVVDKSRGEDGRRRFGSRLVLRRGQRKMVRIFLGKK